jgi:PAS domain S-box-containing protein
MEVSELLLRTDVPVISADHGGTVTAINDSFHEAYGWKAADLVGKHVTTIIPSRFHDAHHTGFARFLTTGQPTILEQPIELFIITSDGREMPAEHFIVASESDDRWIFAAMIRPLA